MRTKVLITVKTYPTLSKTYKELVCTAGIKQDGSWVRIYPVPFRSMEEYKRYEKYQWIEIDLEKNKRDARPESFRPKRLDTIKLLNKIPTGDIYWTARRRIVLKQVRENLFSLIGEAKNSAICTSLAVFKPHRIIDFQYEKVDDHWEPQQLQAAYQMHLFNDAQNALEVAKKLPYKFQYVFEDITGKKSTMMIEDWELGALFWNSFNRKKSEKTACEDVKNKYLNQFSTKDIHFFLGTTKEFHFRARNPFIIIGVFYPEHDPRVMMDL
jgi:hypothetical protein